MFIESIEVLGSPTKYEELGQGLRSLIGQMRAEKGCVDCRLFQDIAHPNAYRLEAHWKTEDDLALHVRSGIYKKLLFLMEMGTEPPMIRFHDVSQTRGMEFIQSVRQG